MADDSNQKAGFLSGKKAPSPAPVEAEPERPAPIHIDPDKMVGFLKKKGSANAPESPLPEPAAAAAAPLQNGAAQKPAAGNRPASTSAARQATAAPRGAAPAARPQARAPVAAPQPPPVGDRVTAEQHLHLGLDHYDRQETEQALTEYQACVQADPSFALGHNNLGMVLIDLERYDEAIASLYESIRCDPNYAEAYNNLGFVLRRMQRQIEAACAYRRFLEIEPDVEEGARIGGWVETVMRDNNLTELPPFSLPQYEQQQEEPPPEPEPPPQEQPKSKIKKMAAWEVAAGNVETAAPISVLGEIESSPAETLKTATVLPSTPRPNIAGLSAPKAAGSGPALPAAARKSNAAQPATRPAPQPLAAAPVARTPAPSPAANTADVIERGMDAFAEGDFDKAADVFKQAIAMEPENAEAHTGLAKVYIRQENFDAGIAELQQSVQFDPQDPAAYYVLGFALRAVERNVEASEAYEMFLKLMPDARDSGKMRDWVKHIKGAANFMAPEDVYVDDEQIVTETDKKYKAALTHFQDGDVDTALREAVRILNEDATHYRTRVLLGRIYLRQKSYDNAVEQLEGSLVTRPDYPEALYFLGQAFEKRGSLDQTTVTYKHYLDVAPQGPRAERLNEWLISHASGDAGLSSQVQCELCLRFFPGSEIRQHEGKATCNNCLVVMGAAPTIVKPMKAQKTSTSSAAVEVTDVAPVAQGGSKKLIVVGGIFGTIAAVGVFLFMSHRLDPFLRRIGVLPPEKKVVQIDVPTGPVWAQPDISKLKITGEPVLQIQPLSTWTYTLTLAGLEDVDEKAKGWKKEYIVKEKPPGMELKDDTLTWRPVPADYEKLKRGETYNVNIAIRGTAKDEGGQTHELFSVAKAFTLTSQFGYEFGPELDLGLDPKEPVVIGTGDLNGDNHADLVSASGQFRHGALRQFINRGENQFAAPVTLSPANSGRYSAVWIGDLDGDKSTDILAVNWQLGRIEPYFLDNNQPVAGKPVSIGMGPVAIAAADFDGAKKLHVAVLLSVGHALAITDLTPDRKFSEVTTISLPSGGGKGYVFPWLSETAPGFVVITPLADLPLHFVPYTHGSWGKPISSAASATDPRMIVAAAALSGGPGKPSRLAIATVSGKTSQVQLLQENGGKFSALGDALNVPSIVLSTVACDLNQDGQEDVLVATADEVRMFFCDPATGLYEGPTYKAHQLSGSAAALHGKAGTRSDLIFLNDANKAVVLRAVSSDSAGPAPEPAPEPAPKDSKDAKDSTDAKETKDTKDAKDK